MCFERRHVFLEKEKEKKKAKTQQDNATHIGADRFFFLLHCMATWVCVCLVCVFCLDLTNNGANAQNNGHDVVHVHAAEIT